MEQGDRTPKRASAVTGRALSLALLAVQLVVFTLGAALAGLGAGHAGAGGRALVVAPSSSVEGAARAACATSDARLEHATRARGDRGDRGASAPPLDLAFPPDVLAVAPAYLSGSLDWRTSVRAHQPLPSVVNGARGPPRA